MKLRDPERGVAKFRPVSVEPVGQTVNVGKYCGLGHIFGCLATASIAAQTFLI
jgi:hypothetical protein